MLDPETYMPLFVDAYANLLEDCLELKGSCWNVRDLTYEYYPREYWLDTTDIPKQYFILAEDGDSTAQTLLANALMAKRGMAAVGEAKSLLDRAVAQNNDRAAFLLGNFYYLGLGVSKDRERALQLYEMAAKQYNFYAALLAGNMYELGNAVAIDLDKAFEMYLVSSCSFMWHEGKFAIASLLARNFDEKILFYSRSYSRIFVKNLLQGLANGGHANAAFLLANILYDNRYGFKQDLKNAFYWIDRAVSLQNLHDAFNDLFKIYLELGLINSNGVFDSQYEVKMKLGEMCKKQFEIVKSRWTMEDYFTTYCRPWFYFDDLDKM